MGATTVKLSGHQAGNESFANDGSYESVALLIKKLAFKCFRRAHSMGLGMTLDDVTQEMNLTYVLCLKQWKPDGGAMFTSYLTGACLNNFNAAVRKPIAERRELGMVNMSDMVRVGSSADDSDMDSFERIDAQDCQTIAISSAMFSGFGLEGQNDGSPEQTPFSADPAWIIEHRQEVRQGMANLSPRAKTVVVDLLRELHSGQHIPRLSLIAKRREIGEAELRRIKAELSKNFGVTI
jgi:DNA-directed RNA polymerase specialized sigma24 family protein